MATVGSSVEKASADKKRKRSIWESLAASAPKGMSLVDFLVPVMVIGLVVAIGAFLYPYVETIFESRNQLEVLKVENATLDGKWQTMQGLNSSAQTQVINSLSKLIPSSLEVSELALYVREVASEYNLEPISLTLENSASIPSIQNVNDVSGMESFQSPENMRVIMGPFSYRGDVESIAGFLDDLTGKGMLISVSDFSISKERKPIVESENSFEAQALDWYLNPDLYENNVWVISFVLVGYTIEGEPAFAEMSPLPVVSVDDINKEIQSRIR